jgi:hypothetical protein
MTAVQFRNPEIRLSEALAKTAAAVQGHQVTLRELLSYVGEQGLLVFTAVLAAPFLFPVSLPFMSTALGIPMLIIAVAVTRNRVAGLPERVLNHSLPSQTVLHVLERVSRLAGRFEHLVKPRLLRLTATAGANRANGAMLCVVVALLMAPLPLVPFSNTLPAIAIILLCLGMAERDGVVILLGHAFSLLAVTYIAALFAGLVYAGTNLGEALSALARFLQARIAG